MAVGLLKISIVFFNRRLTGLTSQRWMVAHYIFLALVVCFMITALFMEVFQCTGPVNTKFSILAKGRYDKPVKCIDGNKMGYGLAIIHSAFDFALLTVPLILLHQMKLSPGKKFRLGFLFSIGSLSCIGSVMRQIIQAQIWTNLDYLWVYQDEYTWIIVDIFFGIVAASLPVLNAALPKHWRSSSNRTPQLDRISDIKSNPKNSIRLDSKETFERPDGTVKEGVGEVNKDSFHVKTEKRRDDALAEAQRPEQSRGRNGRGGTEVSDGTLV